jgi:hypothetical protein
LLACVSSSFIGRAPRSRHEQGWVIARGSPSPAQDLQRRAANYSSEGISADADRSDADSAVRGSLGAPWLSAALSARRARAMITGIDAVNCHDNAAMELVLDFQSELGEAFESPAPR